MPTLKARVLQALDQFNGTHYWDHNAHYHRWIMRQLPRRFETALDVGCGSGELARLLAARAAAAYGIDADAEIVARARELTSAAEPVTFTVGDALTEAPPGPYDVITCVATVHHLPFVEALRHFRRHLAPGGTLVIVGLYDGRTPIDRLYGYASIPLNVALGWLKNKGRRALRPPASPGRAKPAEMSFADIARQARQVLPGARLRHRLFWRYTLIWHAGNVRG